ncbi:MAG: hypothetical protein M3O15_07730 [Acidobacteriota bacterium]|nr:hypothetical protein [Acidobacteriota bacterium]
MRRHEINHAGAIDAQLLSDLEVFENAVNAVEERPTPSVQILDLASQDLHFCGPLERLLGEALETLLEAPLGLSEKFFLGIQLGMSGVQLGGLGIALSHEVTPL